MAKPDGWRLPSDPPPCSAGCIIPVVAARKSPLGDRWYVFGAWYLNRYTPDDDFEEATGFYCDVETWDGEEMYRKMHGIDAWHPMPDPPSDSPKKGVSNDP